MVARVFLTPRHEAVYSQYGFAVYPISVQAVGAVARVAPAHDGSRGPAYGHDLAAMAALVNANTRVVFVANPNNPTGTWLPARELESFVAQLPAQVMVVIDEAYFEYVDAPQYPDSSRWLQRYPNLIVTRTFSKAYGLAGLRVGYALSHPQVAGLLNRVRHNRTGMQQLLAGFEALGLSYIESAGNFIAVDVGRPGPEVYQALLREGVIVRPVANYDMPMHLRITIGRTEENERFLAALRRVLT
jgi:histidinol-phosphate aminotransferase